MTQTKKLMLLAIILIMGMGLINYVGTREPLTEKEVNRLVIQTDSQVKTLAESGISMEDGDSVNQLIKDVKNLDRRLREEIGFTGDYPVYQAHEVFIINAARVLEQKERMILMGKVESPSYDALVNEFRVSFQKIQSL